MATKTLTLPLATASTAFDAAIADLDAKIAELAARRAALKAQARGTAKRRRQRDRLTDRKIQTLKNPGFYADGGNLYLDHKDPPSKNWVLRYTRAGRTHDHGLGAYPAVSLAEARLTRDAALAKLRTGIDPVEERRATKLASKLGQAKAMTFRQCGEAFFAAHEKSWTNAKYAAQWRQPLEAYVYPVFGDSPVAAIDTALVMRAIEPLWGSKTETASRLRGRVENILNWATTRGFRNGENPARWRGHIENLLPKRSKIAPAKSFAALPYGELPGFMTELAQKTGLGALALRFTILTAARTGEVLKARWDEIDLAEKLWIIPGERMKARREHRVPLSEPALEVLMAVRRLPPSLFVFPGHPPQRPVSPPVMLEVMHRMGRAGLTVHGFRSCFRDWAAERTGFPAELAEMALAHSVGTKVEQAYRRSDLFEKRREMMRHWAAYCTGPVPAGGVVSLAGARISA